MGATLAVSSTLLVLILVVRHLEERRRARFAAEIRAKLDELTVRLSHALREKGAIFLEYLHKDVFLKGLHMLTYVALLLVRAVERRLDKGTRFLRSFRKHSKRGTKRHAWHKIRREEDVQNETE